MLKLCFPRLVRGLGSCLAFGFCELVTNWFFFIFKQGIGVFIDVSVEFLSEAFTLGPRRNIQRQAILQKNWNRGMTRLCQQILPCSTPARSSRSLDQIGQARLQAQMQSSAQDLHCKILLNERNSSKSANPSGLTNPNIGDLVVRLGFWGPLYYTYNKDPPPSKSP